jgi:SAM-dependent methyltransferase
VTGTPLEQTAYIEANRAWWDHVVPIHEASQGYDREGFLRGEKPLCPVELEELGPHIEGRSLLHLQCHFGMDTLNWARLGARVTGLDFAPAAIEAARRLSEDSRVPGRFVQSDVYEAPAALESERFDIVYTGIGALVWLPDIERWARVVADCLAEGGRLYVYEVHPLLHALDFEAADQQLRLAYPYFEQSQPLANDGDETYVDDPRLEVTRNYDWNHGLGEVVSALLAAGLRLEVLREHRDMPWQGLRWMEPSGDGRVGADGRYQSGRLWRLPEAQRELVPLMYSLMATKP